MLWFWNELDLIRSWHSEWLNTSWCSPDDGDNSMAPIISHHHQIITHITFVTSSSVKNSKQCSKPSLGPFPAYCHQDQEEAAAFETHNNHLMGATGLRHHLHANHSEAASTEWLVSRAGRARVIFTPRHLMLSSHREHNVGPKLIKVNLTESREWFFLHWSRPKKGMYEFVEHDNSVM